MSLRLSTIVFDGWTVASGCPNARAGLRCRLLFSADGKMGTQQTNGGNVGRLQMSYIFNPTDLQTLAQKHIGLPHEDMCTGITNDLAKAYGRHIYTRENWILNICGGLMGIMRVLHS